MTNSLLERYRRSYHAFQGSLAQTQIVASVAALVLADFPRGLPTDVRSVVADFFESVGKLLREVADDAKNPESLPTQRTATLAPPAADEAGNPFFEEHSKIAMHALQLMLARFPGGTEMRDLGSQFSSLARRQAVAMIFAHLDAFMNDTLRTVCRARPEVLRSSKHITWRTALQFSTIDDLAEHLTEQMIYELGWGTIDKRLDALKDRFGIYVDVPVQEIGFVRLYEQRRNVIMHNGGVVTSRYISDTSDGEVCVGEALIIPSEHVDRLTGVVRMLGSEPFVSVAEKFLDAKHEDLTLIWQRGT